jgi:lipopolysaccharide export system protein LptC
MTARTVAWFPLTILVVVASLTWWVEELTRESAFVAPKEVRHAPDVIVDGLVATRLTPEGRPQHTVTARQVLHFADDDTTVFEQPWVISYGRAAPVVATARSATSDGRGDDIRLYEDVQLVRAAYRDAGGMHSELVMRTSYLQVVPDRNLAVTDRPVTIQDADTHVSANGLEFNNETRVLKLTGNVRGTYTYPKR